MKPPPFSYHDPRTIEDAVGLLAALPNAKALAGGQSLMPMLNMRFVQPDHVVDLNDIAELSGISVSGDVLRVGAMTRQRELEFSNLIAERCPLMREALDNVGHRQTRNRGTIGGSLCHLDPAAELVTVSAAMDAVVEVAGPSGRREIAFAQFPLGYMTPSIEPDEIVVAIRYPLWRAGHGAAFLELARRHGDFAIVSCAALLDIGADGRIARAAIAFGGVAATPVRLTAAEQLLTGRPANAALFAEAATMARGIDAMDDVHAPAAYRQQLAATLTKRALATAHARTQTQNAR